MKKTTIIPCFFILLWYNLLCTFVHGGYGEGVNTVDCGSIMLGFESLYPPHFGFCAHLCAKDKKKFVI